jgi:hypothetical protein
VGQRLRHVARPAGTGRHATGRERLSPQHPTRIHKHHHQRVRACPKKIKFKKKGRCHAEWQSPVVARSDYSVVTRSDRRFTRGGRGSVAGKWLSQTVRVCGDGRVVVARNDNRVVARRDRRSIVVARSDNSVVTRSDRRSVVVARCDNSFITRGDRRSIREGGVV